MGPTPVHDSGKQKCEVAGCIKMQTACRELTQAPETDLQWPTSYFLALRVLQPHSTASFARDKVLEHTLTGRTFHIQTVTRNLSGS